jgi:hypothetical protein
MRISEIKTTNPMRNQKERMDLRERERVSANRAAVAVGWENSSGKLMRGNQGDREMRTRIA